MIIDSLKFRGHGCFVSEWAGFDRIKPVNLIIGRNNSGKSQLLDLVAMMCSGVHEHKNCTFLCSGKLDAEILRPRFPVNASDAGLPGNHWYLHGEKLVGQDVEWLITRDSSASIVNAKGGLSFSEFKSEMTRIGQYFGPLEKYLKARVNLVEIAVSGLESSLHGKEYRHLLADRDIDVEAPNQSLEVFPGGRGATNVIRKYINSSSASVSRETIERDLLGALNEIFGEDGHFDEIRTQEHDEGRTFPIGTWEIHLAEKKKGLIPLSKSGSGLKTVILVLLNLLVIPKIKGKPSSEFVFAFEELENNLHPALLRRLLRYIDRYIAENESTVFLTTHSNVALDMFGTSEHAQIVLVSHDGATAKTSTIDTHFRRHEVLSELGVRPSDILQANGIIWVEGPSDVVYLNRWIELASGGKFKEGRDYLCAFYGGALLARTQFTDPETADADLINLFAANPNFVVICDSDKKSEDSALKSRVQRIRDEVSETPSGMIWITQGKEIENYLTGAVLKLALEKTDAIADPGTYERFFPAEKADNSSYAEKTLGMTHIDKIDLAIRCRPHMSKALMESRLDWMEKMNAIVEKIGRWNS